MLKYLYKFLGLCWHEYEIVHETDIMRTRYNGTKYIEGYLFIKRCKHCNKQVQEKFNVDAS